MQNDQHTPGNELARERTVEELLGFILQCTAWRQRERKDDLRLGLDAAHDWAQEALETLRSSEPQQEAVEQGRVLTFEQVVPSSPQPSAGASNKLADEQALDALWDALDGYGNSRPIDEAKVKASWDALTDVCERLAALRQPTPELFAESAKNSSPGEAMVERLTKALRALDLEVVSNSVVGPTNYDAVRQLAAALATVSPSPDVVAVRNSALEEAALAVTCGGYGVRGFEEIAAQDIRRLKSRCDCPEGSCSGTPGNGGNCICCGSPDATKGADHG